MLGREDVQLELAGPLRSKLIGNLVTIVNQQHAVRLTGGCSNRSKHVGEAVETVQRGNSQHNLNHWCAPLLLVRYCWCTAPPRATLSGRPRTRRWRARCRLAVGLPRQTRRRL